LTRRAGTAISRACLAMLASSPDWLCVASLVERWPSG
jgi:hypothetical protein